jgi:hypothetical protein
MTSAFILLAQKVLEIEKRPMTVNEIWASAVEKGFDKELGSKGKTPSASLGAMMHVDARDNPASLFHSVGARPMRFILKTQAKDGSNYIVNPAAENKKNKVDYLEKTLHPFMAAYGYYYMGAHLKTINHSKSEKRGFGEWVHPDMVGCYFSFKDLGSEVFDVSSIAGTPAIRLFSFELKRDISFSNLREAFFQAVSNSSWANEGYLVVAEIDEDKEFQMELERLSYSFGIGIIKLDVQEPDDSKVLYPARPKEVIDWDTVNKLSGMNSDFRDFLKRIKTDMTSREIRKEMYDMILEREELLSLMK